MCRFKKTISAESPCDVGRLNSDFVSSIASVKDLETENKLLTKMQIPSVTQQDFYKVRKNIAQNKIIEEANKQLCKLQVPQFSQTVLSKETSKITQGKNNELIVCTKISKNSEKNNGIIVRSKASKNSEKNVNKLSSTGKDIASRSIPHCISPASNYNRIFQSNFSENNAERVTLQAVLKQKNVTSALNNDTLPKNVNSSPATKIIKERIISNTVSQQNYISSAVNNNLSFDQPNISQILVDEQFEIKEENNDVENETEYVLPDQTMITSVENSAVVHKQVTLNATIVKQEIDSDLEDNELTGSKTIQMEVVNKKSDREITDKESPVEFEDLPFKKARGATLEEKGDVKEEHDYFVGDEAKHLYLKFGETVNQHNIKLKNHENIQKVPTTVKTEKESGFEIHGLATKTSTVDCEDIFLTPMQHKPVENGSLIAENMPCSVASGSNQDNNRAAFAPGASIAVQQGDELNNSLLPLSTMNSSIENSFSASTDNALIMLPDVSETMPEAPMAIQQPANFSNVVPSTSGITYMTLSSTVAQQSGNSSNTGQRVNRDIPRWIGRENMNNINPSSTLPGGAPKGVSDPILSKPDSNQSKQQSKRTQFPCDDCNVNFAKFESLDLHKKFYCVKRLKLPSSSTVTSNVLINNIFQPIGVTSLIKPQFEELLSAMAIKRSYLEASMKTALDAQYIISLHKSAQNLTRKTFKELDNALNKEKTLTPESSIEEQQMVSEARAQALIKAEAAYNQEKCSAAAVDQALYRQKTAIEASLAASEHEQKALISTLKGLKMQTNQNCMSSVLEDRNINVFDETNLKEKKLIKSSFVPTKVTEQHKIADDISSRSAFIQKSECDATLDILSNNSFNPRKTSSSLHSNTGASSFQAYPKILSCDYFQKVLHSAETGSSVSESMSYDCTQPQEPRVLGASLSFKNIDATVYQIDKCRTKNIQSVEMMDI